MSRIPSLARLWIGGLALVLVATACGSSAEDEAPGIATLSDGSDDSTDDDGVAEDGSGSGGGGSEVEAPDDPEEAFALFDVCMTEAGFDMGGGVVIGGGDGGIDVDGEVIVEEVDPQVSGFDVDDFDFAEFEEANTACEGHLANIGLGFDLTPEQQALFDDAQLAFADCMEEQGIEMPEFGGSGGMVIEIEGDAEVDPQTGELSFDDASFDFGAFEEAAQECDHVFAELDELIEPESPDE